MTILEKFEEEYLVVLQCYASGDGSLSFVFSDKYSNLARPEEVHLSFIKDFIETRKPELKSWYPLKQGNTYKLFQKVRRISEESVSLEGTLYKYSKVKKNLFFIFDTSDNEIKNMNIRAAIMFFVNNEQECTTVLSKPW